MVGQLVRVVPRPGREVLRQDVDAEADRGLETFGPAPGKERVPALWTYRGEENAWYRIDLAPPPGIEPRSAAGQNRALLYDPARDLVLLVLGASDRGNSLVYALRYRDDQAKRAGHDDR